MRGTARIEFLEREGKVIGHAVAMAKFDEFRRVFRVRNLNDEIWLVRDNSFCPIDINAECYVDHGVVDQLSLDDPLEAFREFKAKGFRVETVGWKD